MLYVDGMNGVIQHNETIQWLYSLTASKVSPSSTLMSKLVGEEAHNRRNLKS